LLIIFLNQTNAFASLLKLAINMPGDTYEIASMTVGETFSATMFVNSGSYSFSISIKPVGGSLISLTLTSPYTFSHTATMAATHYFRIGYT
jgi:hypothetical protein